MNKSILMGRLTKDPELRYTNGSNIPVTSFTLAVNRRFQKQGEDRKGDFISCIAWNKTAEFCCKHFTKGQQVGVIGRLQSRSWEDDKGTRHYVTEVVVEETYFADSKKPQEAGADSTNDENDFVTIEEDDDDLPF